MIRYTLLIFMLAGSGYGCSSYSMFAKRMETKPSYETCVVNSSEEMALVKKLNQEAVDAICCGDCQKAEKLLKKALSIDPKYGKAHYNLGVLYARQENYYLAALEFEKAKNLMNDDEYMNINGKLCMLGAYCEDAPTVFHPYLESSIDNNREIARISQPDRFATQSWNRNTTPTTIDTRLLEP